MFLSHLLTYLFLFSYGCLFSDGLVSYSMPQGRTNINSLGDNTYDGQYIRSTHMLHNGLGQLSDGITGSEDITVIDGYQPWIGWSNDTNGFIRISFQFDTIRQINRMTIHTNNVFSKEIFIFKTALVSFSMTNEEKDYMNTIVYQHIRDDIFEIARPVLIELNNQIGRFVRVDFYFDSKWLLISEITFDSQIYQPEKRSFTLANDLRKRYREPARIALATTWRNSEKKASNMVTVELSLAFFIGASLAIGVLLIVVLIWIIRRKKKLQFQK